MKKLLMILVMGLLLTGCQSFYNVQEAKTYDMKIIYANFAVKRYHEGYRFFAVAYTDSKGEIIFSSSKKNIETARSNTIEHCNREWKVNDCYVFESWDLSNIDIEDVSRFVMYGRGPEYFDMFHPKNIELASQTCNEIGFKKEDSNFSSCVLRVIELKNNKQENPSQAAIMSYVSEIKKTQENEIRKKRHWEGIKRIDKILNKGSAF